jgi:FkbM family methyltransferase
MRIASLIGNCAKRIRICTKNLISIPIEKKFRIISIKPIYKIVDRLNSQSVVVDIGTGEDAEFSKVLIKKYGLTSYGFDPTHKHRSSLDSVVKDTNGLFHYYELAISDANGERVFFESRDNRSGSFYSDHVNIKNDNIISYKVKTVSLEEIFHIINSDSIDVLKIDVEGEEYSILSSMSLALLKRINQIVVEFHHENIDRFKIENTSSIIKRLESAGFKSYTIDTVNFLFFV